MERPDLAAKPFTTLFVTEARLERLPDGDVVSPDGVNGDIQWQDYLPGLSELHLAARVRPVDGWTGVRSESTDVTIPRVVPVRHYDGVRGFLGSFPAVLRDVNRAVGCSDLVVVRVPGLLGYLAAGRALLGRQRVAAEVVGDPLDVLNALHGGTPLGRGAARLAAAVLRAIVRRADAVRYVTDQALQDRYPARQGAYTMALGNVRLDPAAYVDQPRTVPPGSPLRLVVVGSQNTSYKGHDTALRVLAALRAKRAAELVVVGGGLLHDDYRRLACQLGVDDAVRFLGHVTESAIIQREMDSADVMLMPSRTEGLPRVVNEAHARALPVVGSNVGGIPEQLPPSLLVAPDDVEGFACAVEQLVDSPERYVAESARALERARPLNASVRRRRFAEWSGVLASLPAARRG